MVESESTALPLGDTPAYYLILGWVVRFELTYTGATTQGLNRLTTPTMLVNYQHCFIIARVSLAYVPLYMRFDSTLTLFALLLIHCAWTKLPRRLNLRIPCLSDNFLRTH